MNARNWTYDETLLAFELYCKTPFGRIHRGNPDIVRLSALLQRTASAVAMKMVNFASLDPELKKRNIKGLSNSSKVDQMVWRDFFENSSELIIRAQGLLESLEREKKSELPQKDATEAFDKSTPQEAFPLGTDKQILAKQRIGQDFFRKTVLASYDFRCCITGISIKPLLIASHIKPWAKSDDASEKTNPRNGLCLNALHDRAFDAGLISIDENYRVMVSKLIKDSEFEHQSVNYFLPFEGKQIELPNKFLPDLEFIRYHNAEIFKG